MSLAVVTLTVVTLLLFPASSFAARKTASAPSSLGAARCVGGRAWTPTLAVLGASFAAGVGATSPRLAWPEDLARLLGWHLALSADPGAGYVNPGEGRRGPFARLLVHLHLAKIDPAIVIVQGGHDDIGYSPRRVESRVTFLITEIEREAPSARIGVLSVFVGRHRPALRAREVNRAIIRGARAADPSVMIFDPIEGHWHFAHLRHHLHPTDNGDRWIARHVARQLTSDGAFAGRSCQPVSRLGAERPTT